MSLQILVFFVSITETSGFLLANKCIAPPPCTCDLYVIDCSSKQLSQVPVFTLQNDKYSSTILNVYLNQNQLASIPAYAFKNLAAINATSIQLDLEHNHISIIETHAFCGVETKVTHIYLEGNNLTHIPIALAELSSLHHLDLSENPLITLDGQVFANISSSLKSLSISLIRFSNFPNELLPLINLSSLVIHGINFSMSQPTLLYNYKNSLISLFITDANFESIPAAVSSLNSLKSFRIDHTPTLGRDSGSILDECTHRLTNVTSLSMHDDKLTTIPNLANVFPSLEILGLQANAIHFIESDSLAGLSSLTYLNIGINRLTRIPFAVNQAFNLRVLHMAVNQIHTVEDMDLSLLQNLTWVDLRDNPVVYISPHAFSPTPLLSGLELEVTNIGHVPRAILGLQNLNHLSISGTPIDCSCHSMGYLNSWNVSSVDIVATCDSGKSVKAYLTSDLPKCP